eukprot:3071019-Prymnesium_polylepis.1
MMCRRRAPPLSERRGPRRVARVWSARARTPDAGAPPHAATCGPARAPRCEKNVVRVPPPFHGG